MNFTMERENNSELLLKLGLGVAVLSCAGTVAFNYLGEACVRNGDLTGFLRYTYLNDICMGAVLLSGIYSLSVASFGTDKEITS